jgi:MFS family permease
MGCSAFICASLPIALGLVTGSSPAEAWIVVRVLQGIGIAAVFPSIGTLVPLGVPRARIPTAMATVGMAGNLSLAVTPFVALLMLEQWGLASVGIAVTTSVLTGALLLGGSRRFTHAAASSRRGIAGTLRPAWRPAWTVPLIAAFLFICHWGVVSGYLPQRAAAAGADVGLYFTGDALAILVLRVPAGMLMGRVAALPMLLTGACITAASLLLLLLPPTTLLLLVAGIIGGAGVALFMPVIQVELVRRSDDRDRGSAFGLYSVAFAAGVAAGSLGIAPLYDLLGFERSMAAAIACCLGAGVVALTDADLRHRRPM